MKLSKICGGKTFLILLLLAAEALIAMSPLLSPGWFGSHDNIWHLDRLFAVTHEMESGDYYPRWLSAACFGKGLPVLNYYAPAFYLIAGGLHVAGIPLVVALKIIIFATFFGGSLGMYLWLRSSCNEAGALIAATIYLFLPYHFLDLYVRGAVPEFMALALLPFLFHGIDISLSAEGTCRGVVIVAVVSAAILLTHNLSALMVAPFALLLFGWYARTRELSLRTIVAAAAGPLLGAGISAFYWLPVLVETRHLDRFKETLTGGYLGYENHFLRLAALFSPDWGFGFSGPGQTDEMALQLGYPLLAFAVVAAVALVSATRESRNFAFITLALGSLALFLTTAAAALWYELIPTYQIVQFPWRFLGIATLFFAAFTGLATSCSLTAKHARFLLGIAILLSLMFSVKQRSVQYMLTEDLDHLEATKLREQTIGILGSRNEFRPRWAPSYGPLDTRFTAVISSTVSTHVTDIARNGAKISFRVVKTDDAPLTIPWFYFPGWQAESDGVRVAVSAVGRGLHRGFLSVPVPAGSHTVRIWFGTTWPRMAGWLITIVTFVMMGVGASVLCRRKEGIDFRRDICVHG